MSQSILITGASSGIGEALAREYARRGARLALAARRLPELDALATELRATGSPRVVTRALDVSDFSSIAPVIESMAAELGGLDVVIANAGVAHVVRTGEGRLAEIRQTLDVNLTGACLTIDAAVALFRRSGGGQVVGVTSVARYRGLPRFAVYSASKAGLHTYLQAVRLECRNARITVTELAPGYIDTPMNRGADSRPFVVDAQTGARIMAELITRRVEYATVPQWPWRLLGRVMQVLPESLVRRFS